MVPNGLKKFQIVSNVLIWSQITLKGVQRSKMSQHISNHTKWFKWASSYNMQPWYYFQLTNTLYNFTINSWSLTLMILLTICFIKKKSSWIVLFQNFSFSVIKYPYAVSLYVTNLNLKNWRKKLQKLKLQICLS